MQVVNRSSLHNKIKDAMLHFNKGEELFRLYLYERLELRLQYLLALDPEYHKMTSFWKEVKAKAIKNEIEQTIGRFKGGPPINISRLENVNMYIDAMIQEQEQHNETPD